VPIDPIRPCPPGRTVREWRARATGSNRTGRRWSKRSTAGFQTLPRGGGQPFLERLPACASAASAISAIERSSASASDDTFSQVGLL
jgi:hypothetical protein